MVSDSSSPSTRSSLIRRVRRPEDQEAWADFVTTYGSAILRWCRSWQLQDADAHDLTQVILVRVWDKLPSFEYDAGRSFRAWLWTLSHHVFLDSVRRNTFVTNVDQAHVEDLLDKQAREFATNMEREFERELLRLACNEVQRVVAQRDWDVFTSTTFKNIQAKQLAQQHHLTVGAVYVLNQRMRQKIKDSMATLEASMLKRETA